MTTPDNPLVDLGNQLLAQVPARMDTGTITTPAGKSGVLTFRTASTTLTVFVGASDLRDWAKIMNQLASDLSGGLTVASAADIAALGPVEFRGNQNGHGRPS